MYRHHLFVDKNRQVIVIEDDPAAMDTAPPPL